MVQLRVANVTRVSLSPVGGATCPEEPIRLSFLDTVWIPLPPVQRLFLYGTVDRPLAAVAQDLRASLSRVLPRFRSLAGTLTHLPDSGDVVISFCGDGRDGVDVLEAEAEGADFRRLAEDEDHDLEAFSSLVPPLDVRELPAPVFAVQVTGFGGGGVAVGLSLLHVVADGKALWLFVEAWAAECRRAVLGGCGGAAVAPVLDRSVIKCPDDEDLARSYTRTATPDLPKVSFLVLGVERKKCCGALAAAADRRQQQNSRGARTGASPRRRPHRTRRLPNAPAARSDDPSATQQRSSRAFHPRSTLTGRPKP